MYVASPIQDSDTLRFRFDPAFFAEGDTGEKIMKQYHQRVFEARKKSQ